jgi:hypothetical protein
MIGNTTPEQKLDIVRELIERTEIYRAVSARTALIAGLLSISVAGAIYVNDEVTRILLRPVGPWSFAFIWLSVLLMTLFAGTLILRSVASDTRGVGASRRMSFAFRIVAPYLVIPAAFTSWFLTTGFLGAAEQDLIVVWIAFYGLMLLSTAFFAPRSFTLLGWAFLLTSLSVPLIADNIDNWVGSVPTVLMGITFGVYHLIYAALNWRRIPASQ